MHFQKNFLRQYSSYLIYAVLVRRRKQLFFGRCIAWTVGVIRVEKRIFAVAEEFSGQDIKCIRKKLRLTQKEFANLVNVSVTTVERWESGKKSITGPVVTLGKLLKENPQMAASLKIPEKKYPLRLWYMCGNEICTVIDVDELKREVEIKNFTSNFIYKAFGNNETPTFAQYEEFLEARCFPRDRDKMKLILQDLGLPFYEPMLIIEKTQGRMAEDNFWIKIEKG